MDFSQVLQGVTIALLSGIGGWLIKSFGKAKSAFNDVKNDFNLLKDAERQDLKTDIVAVYQNAQLRGSITPLELDTTCGKYEKYKSLGGNTYIDTIMERIKEMPIEGEAVPEHDKE